MARRPFADTLRDLRGGAVLDELAEQMQHVVDAVSTTQAAGKLTLTITVKPQPGTDAFLVADEIKATLPRQKSKGSLLFPTPEGNLQRLNPNQRELPGMTLATANETKEVVNG
jgi:hypothetical protein